MTSIVWFRQDLWLADNPALAWAARRGSVFPVYIWTRRRLRAGRSTAPPLGV
jgi:deoxyribodipyrimidine photolyase